MSWPWQRTSDPVVRRPPESRFTRRPPRPDLWRLWDVSLEHDWDWINPLCLAALAVAGVFFIYSSQLATGGSQWLYQLVWLGAGLVCYTVIALTDYRIFMRFSHWVYVAGLVALLALTALAAAGSPFAPMRFGAHRWIDFGPASFQPSEAAKLAILITVAAVVARNETRGLKAAGRILLIVGGLVLLPTVLILTQPDLGSTLVIFPMVFAILYVSSLPRRVFVAGALLVTAAIGLVAWDVSNYQRFLKENDLSPVRDRGAFEPVSPLPLRDYQRNRILAFVAPDQVDPMGIGWNLRQSLISVGSGGLTGKGWTEGTQARLGYLPRGVAHNDFIFSVLAEEKGFLGSAVVLTLFGIVLCNGIRIASNARDRFGLFLAVGVTALFAVHVFVNIAMTIGLMPIKGLPLPMVSYGGSFILSCCILQGIVQSVHRFRRAY